MVVSRNKYKFFVLTTAVFVIFTYLSLPGPAQASKIKGTISTDGQNAGYAWSSNVGAINFGVPGGNIHITDSALDGSALNSDYGLINLAPANGGVTNDGNGILGGFAWGEKLDWINFTGVTIDKAGRFHGQATGSLVGTLSFDCDACNVSTDWRPVSARRVAAASVGDIATGATTEAAFPPPADSVQSPPLFDVAQSAVLTTTGNLVTRIAPGELLPISVKLTNFGGGQKVDVVITYNILNPAGTVVLTTSDTVAVETTASFIKVLQIPREFAPGKYTAQSSIVYLAQTVPATSSYQFTVERKFLGIFVSNLILYAIVVLFIVALFVILSYLFRKKNQVRRFAPEEYPEVASADRMFYELISDAIMQMRFRAGDRAIQIAKNIPGLVINEETGRVLELKKKPAQIMASLISKYEELLDKKISFAFRKHAKGPATSLMADENLVVFRKQ